MAKGKGPFIGTPYNQTEGDADKPDDSGAGNYVSYDEVMSMHLSEDGADLDSSDNSESGHGIMGGPAPGEPNPSGQSTMAQAKGSKK